MCLKKRAMLVRLVRDAGRILLPELDSELVRHQPFHWPPTGRTCSEPGQDDWPHRELRLGFDTHDGAGPFPANRYPRG